MSEFSISEIDKILEQCIECNLCIEECEFLKQVCQTPTELAERFKGGEFREKPQVPYSCNLCNLCQEICPCELNIGKMCLELRQQMVEEGLAPLPAHKKFVESQQEWTFSLHDSCRARWERDLQDSVRTLTSRMGYRIGEMSALRHPTYFVCNYNSSS